MLRGHERDVKKTPRAEGAGATEPELSSKFKKKVTAYDRYVEKELRPWKERGGGQGLFGNPDAGDQPPLKPSPAALARAVGRAAADVVTKSHAEKALVEAIKAHMEEK